MEIDSRFPYKEMPSCVQENGFPEWQPQAAGIPDHAGLLPNPPTIRATMNLRHEQVLTVTIPEPFDFTLTIAKPAGWHWSTPKEVFEGGTLWTGVRIGNIPVGLVMNATKNKVRVRAFTGSPLTKPDISELGDLIRTGLGADEDLAGFYRFAEKNPYSKSPYVITPVCG